MYYVLIGRWVEECPAYWVNFYEYICDTYDTYDNQFDRELINKELKQYRAKLNRPHHRDIDKSVLSFKSEEDFVYFKLKWS